MWLTELGTWNSIFRRNVISAFTVVITKIKTKISRHLNGSLNHDNEHTICWICRKPDTNRSLQPILKSSKVFFLVCVSMFTLTTSPMKKNWFRWRFIFCSSSKRWLNHFHSQTKASTNPKKKYQPRYLNFTLFNRVTFSFNCQSRNPNEKFICIIILSAGCCWCHMLYFILLYSTYRCIRDPRSEIQYSAEWLMKNENKVKNKTNDTNKSKRQKFCDAFKLTQYLGCINEMESYACALALVFNISLSLFQLNGLRKIKI